MIKINENFLNINEHYLFSEISQIVEKVKMEDKNIRLINMSIGDVTLPLSNKIIEALHKAVDDMGNMSTFKGYAPDQGYLFLREAIKDKYLKYKIELNLSDIFVNDGAKSDIGNILEVFSNDNIVGLQSVSYPVYFDVCKIGGFKVSFFKSCQKNDFLPLPNDLEGEIPNIIYLCSPNNPTGMAYNKAQLKLWLDFALENKIIILYDSAYQDFIVDKEIPYSIYELEEAKRCAIEICSFSKCAGFTGLRCGYTIIPKEIEVKVGKKIIKINKLWQRRQATKFNGTSYITQRAAEAYLKTNSKQYVDHCHKNSKKLMEILSRGDKKFWGGLNSPYIWVKNEGGKRSKEYFEYLIREYGIVTTPGEGFGKDGDGFIRISTFFNIEEREIEKFFFR